MAVENIDYDGLKKRGFLRQRQDGFFVVRTRMTAHVYTKKQLQAIAVIAEQYGKGFAHATTRQGLEMPFIKYDDISKVEGALRDAGLAMGTSGPRLRTTTACPGTNWCKQGLIDTFALSSRIENELGICCAMDLPHKFKISISGCANGCTRADASEIGIHGQVDAKDTAKRIGYTIYLAGCGGRTPRSGIKLDKVFTEDEVLTLIRRVVGFFKAHAKPRQRLGALVEEIGKEEFLKKVM